MELKNKDIIKEIYEAQFEKLDNILKNKTKEIEKNFKQIYEKEGIEKDSSKRTEIIKEMYDKKIATCIEEFYKQGFKDGVNLIINCLE